MLDVERLEEAEKKKADAEKEYVDAFKPFQKRAEDICKLCSNYKVMVKYSGEYYINGHYSYERYDVIHMKERNGIVYITTHDIDFEEQGVIEITKEDFISDDILERLEKKMPEMIEVRHRKDEAHVRDVELQELARLKAKYSI